MQLHAPSAHTDNPQAPRVPSACWEAWAGPHAHYQEPAHLLPAGRDRSCEERVWPEVLLSPQKQGVYTICSCGQPWPLYLCALSTRSELKPALCFHCLSYFLLFFFFFPLSFLTMATACGTGPVPQRDPASAGPTPDPEPSVPQKHSSFLHIPRPREPLWGCANLTD